MTFHVPLWTKSAWAQVNGLRWGSLAAPDMGERIPTAGEIGVRFANRKARRLYDIEPTGYNGVFLFAERVATFLTNSGFKGIEFHPVRIDGHELDDVFPRGYPRYFWTRITGTIGGQLFFNGKPVPTDPTGKEILVPTKDRIGVLREWHLDLGKWDGSDFCWLVPFGIGTLVCTSRFADAVRAQRWNNFNLSITTDSELRLRA